MSFAEQFQKFVEDNHLFTVQDPILVAISGGIDSTSLLHVMASLKYNIALAHCNFSLRGDESDGDEQLVRDLQKHYGIKGYYIKFETEKEAKLHGESIEMAARRLRYNWFGELCANYGYKYVAIAHNADDIAETFLLNVTRGTGIRGLTGIKAKSGNIVRPLLFAPRKQLEEYSNSEGLRFREDSSNNEDKYVRNRIRHNVIPQLKSINPAFNQTMSENLERLRMVENLLNNAAEQFRKGCTTTDANGLKIDTIKALCHPDHQLLMYEMLKDFGFNGPQIKEISALLPNSESGKYFYSPSHTLLIDRNALLLYPTTAASDERIEIAEYPCELKYPISIELKAIEKRDNFAISKDPKRIHLDADKIHFPLCIRKWKHGDEFQPLGMNGRKKISDFFIDQKYSLREKEDQWLLCDQDEILWIIGKRISDIAKITANTQSMIEIEVL